MSLALSPAPSPTLSSGSASRLFFNEERRPLTLNFVNVPAGVRELLVYNPAQFQAGDLVTRNLQQPDSLGNFYATQLTNPAFSAFNGALLSRLSLSPTGPHNVTCAVEVDQHSPSVGVMFLRDRVASLSEVHFSGGEGPITLKVTF